eukprot:scaffold116242_cov71-Attheya_sp.AAC.1
MSKCRLSGALLECAQVVHFDKCVFGDGVELCGVSNDIPFGSPDYVCEVGRPFEVVVCQVLWVHVSQDVS